MRLHPRGHRGDAPDLRRRNLLLSGPSAAHDTTDDNHYRGTGRRGLTNLELAIATVFGVALGVAGTQCVYAQQEIKRNTLQHADLTGTPAAKAQRRKRPGRRLSASAYPSRMLLFKPIPGHLGNGG